MGAFAEVTENHKRAEVFFSFDRKWVDGIKQIAGARFVPKDKGGPKWTVPLEMVAMRQLRELFGEELEMGDALRVWASRLNKQANQLKTLSSADTAELKRLPEVLPVLYQAIHLGPKGRWMSEEERSAALAGPASFQAADVAFGVIQQHPFNGNQMGAGKTLETIATIFEGGTDDGPSLVVAPKTALRTTWLKELEKWQTHPVYVSSGGKANKMAVLEAFEDEIVFPGFSGWLVVNPDQVRYREEFNLCTFHKVEALTLRKPALKAAMKECPDCEYKLVSEFPMLHEIKWKNIVIDEAHKNAIRNPSSLTAKGMFGIKLADDGKRFALTGTPMGGKLINLWGILHYLNPEAFTSKWRWAEQWCGVKKETHGSTIGRNLKMCSRHTMFPPKGDSRPDCDDCNTIEEQFYEMLLPYMIRRTKAEIMPWLPAKQYVEVECEFGSDKHAAQYKKFREEAEVIISQESITAAGVLAQYTRLKQFATAYHDIVNGRLVPTIDSGKLESLEQKLDELGIFDEDSDEQVVIASQFSQVVDMVVEWLKSKGVPTAKITGSTNKAGERDRIQDEFQEGGKLKALVMTTTAGGVSITLDRASNVFILDETWDPDDQEQLEDRCHRASRIHQVTVYYFRTSKTIEQYIQDTTAKKSWNNMTVLDLKRINESSDSDQSE